MSSFRIACRSLIRDPGFLVTALIVLGLGIGVTHMFLTIVYAHTLRGLPIPRADRVLYLSTIDDRQVDRPLTAAEFDTLRTSARSFQSLIGYTTVPVAVGDDHRAPERVDASFVSLGAFHALGITTSAGRDFAATDHQRGAPPVAVISRGLWQARYGGDAAVVGNTLLVNGSPVTVVGIVPDRQGFPSTAALWMPLEPAPDDVVSPASNVRSLRVFARLADSASEGDARAEVAGLVERVIQESPGQNRNLRSRVMPIDERFFGRIEGPWLAFLIAGCVIVLVSAANAANLMLARAMDQAREVAVRTAMGASRARIVGERLAEALALALAAGSIALLVSRAGIALFSSAIPAGTLPDWIDYSLDWRVFAALVGVSLAALLGFGLVPALLASSIDLRDVLSQGGRSLAGRRGTRRWTHTLLAVQVGLGVILLSTITVASLNTGSTVASDAVIETADVTTASLSLPADRYATPESRARFFDQLLERVRSIPGVTAAALASSLPRSGAPERAVVLEALDAGAREGTAYAVSISPDYFRSLGLTVVKGRDLVSADGRGGAPNVLVNERFADRFLSGRSVVGSRLALRPPGAAGTAGEWLSIAGVVPDIRQRNTPDPDPVVYLPLPGAAPPTAMLIVRTETESGIANLLRDVTQAVDPIVPLYRVQTMRGAIRDADWNARVSARLAVTLTLLCLLLAATGLYAVAADGVARRRRELGVRMSLGATPFRIVRLILAGVTPPVLAGLCLGVIGAIAWERAFPAGRPGPGAASPLVLLGVSLVLSAIVIVACLNPARRAVILDPARVLREE